MLTGSMLTLSVPAVSADCRRRTSMREDAVIRVEATDTDGESAVAYVKVRGNDAPTAVDQRPTLALTVGTQAAAADDGDDPDTTILTMPTGGQITCATLNVCTTSMIGDRDCNDVTTDIGREPPGHLTWSVRDLQDHPTRCLLRSTGGVMITGLKATAAATVEGEGVGS